MEIKLPQKDYILKIGTGSTSLDRYDWNLIQDVPNASATSIEAHSILNRIHSVDFWEVVRDKLATGGQAIVTFPDLAELSRAYHLGQIGDEEWNQVFFSEHQSALGRSLLGEANKAKKSGLKLMKKQIERKFIAVIVVERI